jgi:hypothetical protein
MAQYQALVGTPFGLRDGIMRKKQRNKWTVTKAMRVYAGISC